MRQVFQVRKRSSGKIYAMKVLKKRDVLQSASVNHATAERAVLAQASHPFIVNLRYAFQSESKLYLILDYVAGGEVRK
jgi:serine/threonine protein kinase